MSGPYRSGALLAPGLQDAARGRCARSTRIPPTIPAQTVPKGTVRLPSSSHKIPPI